MAEAYTQVSSLNQVGTAAYQALAYYSLRPELFYQQFATVRPTNQTHKGASVTFHIYDEMAAATSALTETVDPDSVAISDSAVTLTLAEYGNAVNVTAKAEASAITSVDMSAANLVGYNAGLSFDTLARTALVGGTNVLYGGNATATANIDATDTLGGAVVSEAVAKLRGNNARGFGGSKYATIIHPDQSYDLRRETGVANWVEAAINSDGSRVWNGHVGDFAGSMVIESPRTRLTADAGSTTTDVYDGLVIGAEALAYAHSSGAGYGALPTIVVGPVVDKLERFRPIGWKAFCAWGIFRQAALYRIETASSIGAN